MRASRFLACILSVALAALTLPADASSKHHHTASEKQTSPVKASSGKKAVSKAKAAKATKPAKATKGDVAPKVAKASAKSGAKKAVAAKSSASIASAKPSKMSAADRRAARLAAAKEKKEAQVQALREKQSRRQVANAEPELDRDGMPLLKSSAFIVQDVNSGKILLEKNSNVAQPIASISKLMTAMVVLDAHQNLTDTLEVTDADVDNLKGTSSRLAVGTRLSREEMMTLALMASENRAATALSRNYPGGQPAFIEAMNAKARALGMHESKFFDPSGLNKNNVSSPHDLALMVSAASKYPLIREFSTQEEYTAVLHGGRSHTFHNTNALVKNSDWQIDVQKTGYINESGKCLVMQAWMASKQVAVVLLDSWGKYTRIGDAVRVRKWVETTLARQNVAALQKSGANKTIN